MIDQFDNPSPKNTWCRCLYCKQRPGFEVEELGKHVKEKHPLFAVPSWPLLPIYMFYLVHTDPADWVMKKLPNGQADLQIA